MRVFHGTNVTVTKPEVRVVGYTKDFGYGFLLYKIGETGSALGNHQA